jgi:hypothetical protein
MAARFLPHTDLDLFPSVREQLVKARPEWRGSNRPS